MPSVCTSADAPANSYGATYGYYWSETGNRWVQAPACYARWGYLQASPSQIVQPGATVTVTVIPDDSRMAGLVATFGGMAWTYPGTRVSGCATTDVVCTVRIGEAGVRPQEWVWSEFHVSGPGRVFILPPSYAPRCQPENPCLDTYTNAWSYVGIGPEEPSAPELSATLRATPPELFVGDPFTLRMTVTNPSQVTLSDIAPAPRVTQTGAGAARLVSGPTPASVPALAPNASTTFVWEFESTEPGALVLQARVEGLGGDGQDKNDKDDADTGPNDRMNSPVVLAAKKYGSKEDNPISAFVLQSGAL